MEVIYIIICILLSNIIPILKMEDEFWDLEEGASSVNEVRDVPEGFRDWVKENEARIREFGSLSKK